MLPTHPQAGVLPRRDLFRGKGYLPLTLLQFSRGCPYRCSYCATSVFFHRTHRHRPVGEVVEEIRAQRRRYLFFVDDNIVADHEAAKELFQALIPLRVRWVSQASLDMLRDPELMHLMVRSGCQGHVIGFESLTDAGLRVGGQHAVVAGAQASGGGVRHHVAPDRLGVAGDDRVAVAGRLVRRQRGVHPAPQNRDVELLVDVFGEDSRRVEVGRGPDRHADEVEARLADRGDQALKLLIRGGEDVVGDPVLEVDLGDVNPGLA